MDTISIKAVYSLFPSGSDANPAKSDKILPKQTPKSINWNELSALNEE